MKHSLPLLAVLAASVATPLLAQDISSFLNPRAMAAQIGLSGNAATAYAVPRETVPDIRLRAADATALLGSITTHAALDVATSPRPLMRPDAAQGPIWRPGSYDRAGITEGLGEIRTHGGNTTVVTGANTAVISGADTAIIHSSGATSAAVARVEQPRPSFWRRLFGL